MQDPYTDKHIPTTGQEIKHYLHAKSMGLKAGPKGYLTKQEVEEFLRSKGAL